jgi:hypothetical protein
VGTRAIERHASAMSDADAPLLFCPFCRECFEGEKQCPEHELALVPFHELPRQAHERGLPGWDEPVVPWDVRFGRGFLGLGVAIALVGFFCPVVIGTYDDRPHVWSGFEMANGPARNLWTVPVVAALFVVFLYRRRTPRQMRGSRLAGIVLALMPAISLAYSLYHVHQGALATHGAVGVSFAFGAYVIAACTPFLLIGSLRFGAMPREHAPHGSTPDEEPRIAHDRPRKKGRRRRRK